MAIRRSRAFRRNPIIMPCAIDVVQGWISQSGREVIVFLGNVMALFLVLETYCAYFLKKSILWCILFIILLEKSIIDGVSMQIKKTECPSCGAPVEFKPGEQTTFCAYCNCPVHLESNRYEIVYRDEARLQELRYKEAERQARSEKEEFEREKNELYSALSILTSDEAGQTLKSVGKLAMKFLKELR